MLGRIKVNDNTSPRVSFEQTVKFETREFWISYNKPVVR